MALTNKSGGKGTTDNGLPFEGAVESFFIDKFREKGYKVTSEGKIYKIWDGDTIKALMGMKTAVLEWLNLESNFKSLSKKFREDKFVPTKRLRNVWVKDLNPDLMIMTLEPSPKFHVVEIKFQGSAGSTDEKLQTGEYKREMWRKLFRQLIEHDTDINYTYVLSNWFLDMPKKGKHTLFKYKYEAEFEYLKNKNIKCYVNHNIDMKQIEEVKIVEKDGKEIEKKKIVTRFNGDKPNLKVPRSKPYDKDEIFDIEEFLK